MAQTTKTKQSKHVPKAAEKKAGDDAKMALAKRNYIIMLIGFALVVIGFVLMTGGASSDPVNEFNYEMFSFRRITLSTILTLGGFVVVAYGIMSKGKKESTEE